MGVRAGASAQQVAEIQPTANYNPLTGQFEAISVELGDISALASEETLGQLLEEFEEINDDDTPVPVQVVPSLFETIAASVTDQMMGTTGAIGDTLAALLVTPTVTTIGPISIEYGSTNIVVYSGGTVGADLKPFVIPLFNIATPSGGGWEITTGVGCSVLAFGKFT